MNAVEPFTRICASCKRVHEEDGQWTAPSPIGHALARVSHGICPACTKKLYPKIYGRLAQRHPELFRKQA
jgi:hypothetical protein